MDAWRRAGGIRRGDRPHVWLCSFVRPPGDLRLHRQFADGVRHGEEAFRGGPGQHPLAAGDRTGLCTLLFREHRPAPVKVHYMCVGLVPEMNNYATISR